MLGRDSSIGKLSASHAESLGLNPNASMRWEEITSCKNHITPVNLTDWSIMIFLQNKNK